MTASPPAVPFVRDPLRPAFAALQGVAQRRPRLILALAVSLAVAACAWLAANLRFAADPAVRFAAELPFQRDAEALARSFPQFGPALTIVVEADNADLAEDAAEALAERLKRDRGRFLAVYYPEADPFFRQNGLLYLDTDALQAYADRLAEAQPLLSAVARDPSLRGLFALVGEAADALATPEGRPDKIVALLDRVTEAVAARTQGRARPLAWQELMTGETGVRARRQAIHVLVEAEPGAARPYGDVAAAVLRHAAELGLGPGSDVRVGMTGSAALAGAAARAVFADAALALAAVALALLLATVWALRRGAAIAATALSAFVATAVAAALGAPWAGAAPLELALAPALLMAMVAVPAAAIAGRDPARAPSYPWTIAIVVPLAGGWALQLGADRALAALGKTLAFGAIVAPVAAIAVVTALRTVRPWVPAAAGRGARFVARLHRRATPWRMALPVVGFLTLALGLGLVPGRGDPYGTAAAPGAAAELAERFARDPRFDLRTVSVLVDSVEEIDTMTARLKALPEVGKVTSIFDLVPEDQTVKLDILEEASLQLLPVLSPSGRELPPDRFARRAAIDALLKRARAAVEEGRAGPAEPSLKRLADALEAFAATTPDAPRLAALEGDLVGTLPRRLEGLRDALSARPFEYAALPETVRQREISPTGRARIEVTPKRDLRDPGEHRRFVAAVLLAAPHAAGVPVEALRRGQYAARAGVAAGLTALFALGFGIVAVSLRWAPALATGASILSGIAAGAGLAILLAGGISDAQIACAPFALAAAATAALPGWRRAAPGAARAMTALGIGIGGAWTAVAILGHGEIADQASAIAGAVAGALLALPFAAASMRSPRAGVPSAHRPESPP